MMAEMERGWQPDPDNPGFYRWNDGKKLTDHTAESDPLHPTDPGWYEDPDDPTTGLVRHWDGTAWAEPIPPDEAPATIRAEWRTVKIVGYEEKRVGDALYGSSTPGVEEPLEPTTRIGEFISKIWGLYWLFGLAIAALLLVFLVIALNSGGDDEDTATGDPTTTTVCVAAEFDLAPGAPDPCAPTPGVTTPETSVPTETKTATSPAADTCTPRTFKGSIDGSVVGKGAPLKEHYEQVELTINPDCSLSTLLVWVAEYPEDVTANNPDGIWCAAFIGEDFNIKVKMTDEDSGVATGRLSANVEGPMGHCPPVDYPTDPTGIGSYLRQAGQDATFNLAGDTLTGAFTGSYGRFTVTFTATEEP